MNNPKPLFTPIPFIRRSSAGQNCGKAHRTRRKNYHPPMLNPLSHNNFPNLSPPFTLML
jgi:hypothetical protein